MEKRSKIKEIKWKILDLVLMAVFVILSLDILYLYYSGAWYDPYKIIEMSCSFNGLHMRCRVARLLKYNVLKGQLKIAQQFIAGIYI